MAANIKNLDKVFENGWMRIWVYKGDENGESDTAQTMTDAAGDVGTFFDSLTEALERIQVGDLILMCDDTGFVPLIVTANSGSSITTATQLWDGSPAASLA